MSILRVSDGSTFSTTVDFVDEDNGDTPVAPRPGYPRVALLDKDKTVIAQYNVVPSSTPGTWEASISLPELGVTQPTEYRLRWRLLSVDGEKWLNYTTVVIEPKADRRESEIVFLQGDETADLTVPFKYVPSNTATYQVFEGNEPITERISFDDVEVEAGFDRSVVAVPFPEGLEPSLAARLLVVRTKIKQRPKTLNYKAWVITPQIALAASMVEEFLNKSRIENVIPELEYTYSDLLSYLERGLYMFNMVQYPTAFTGTNMQGMLLECWVICSTYWAIGAQLIAEGSLAFDFSGQGVSLNVDRTPQLDSALGRIEARIQDQVLPFKKQIVSQGFIAGDGSQGKTAMRNAYSGGTLGLINAPTTRVGGLNGFTNYYGGRKF